MPRIGTWYTLGVAEQRQAIDFTEARTAGCRRDGAEDRKRCQTGVDIELEGAAAEMAFCYLYGVPPDLSVVSGTRPLVDAVIDGVRIDVKSTTWETGKMVVQPSTIRKAGVDAFALITGRFPGPYTLRGFATFDQVKSRLGVFNGRPCHLVLQKELSEFDTIRELWFGRLRPGG